MRVTIFPSAARTATANSPDQSWPGFKAAVFVLDISAVSGVTPTLDVKIQYQDHISGNYVDIPGAAFAQKSATGTDSLLLFPGVAETANREVSVSQGEVWRAVATIGGGTPSFTFSLSAQLIP